MNFMFKQKLYSTLTKVLYINRSIELSFDPNSLHNKKYILDISYLNPYKTMNSIYASTFSFFSSIAYLVPTIFSNRSTSLAHPYAT